LNHFAKDLKLPIDLESCVQILKHGAVQSVDVAEVNGRVFLNNSGLGLYPAMVARREKRRRLGQHKWIAMLLASAATLQRFPFLDVRLTAAGQALRRRTPFVFVGNNAYRMEGINLGSRDSLSEGCLSVGIAQYRIGRWGMVRLAIRALFLESPANATSMSSSPPKCKSPAAASAFTSRSMASWRCLSLPFTIESGPAPCG
jgi:Sphingosine kinase and enzymes related to eukaryotic diacylglycerol kinase